MHLARIMLINLHSSFAVHIVLPVLNSGSLKGSLGPFYSNLGYGLLPNRLMCTLKVDNHLLTKLIAIKITF